MNEKLKMEQVNVMEGNDLLVRSISVDWNGWNFKLVYGSEKNDWFVAIPNWKVCVECASPWEEKYNAKKLGDALYQLEAGEIVAKSIKEDWVKNGRGN